MTQTSIEARQKKFGALLEEQLKRVEQMKKGDPFADYAKLSPILIGICWGDGIGEFISRNAQEILAHVLKDEVKKGKIAFREIKGLTIENRVKHNKAIPDDILEELEACHVILKGPTTTPQVGDPWPNIESANVAMRRALDLFANVRPVKIPREGVDWCFFRENTEGAYILGSKGFDVTEDLSVDFTVATEQGSERIIRMAFDYARKNNIDRVTVITKSNVIKTTDGRFSRADQAHREGIPEDPVRRMVYRYHDRQIDRPGPAQGFQGHGHAQSLWGHFD